ncbi:MAG: cytochrome C oxidase subunit II [Deltaproteobacteria bacterium]|jgi:cytochrome c oxidase subunit 2|nr:cytochrome C oxidase subunit II [Deltaproteobacteria bacterium]
MSIYNPPAGWFKAPTGAERLWVGLALTWCIIMSLAMPYWHFYGKQNSTGESYRVSVADYGARVQQFVESNTVGTEQGVPIVEIAPGGDGYLLARMWAFYPIIKLKKGQTYRLHISSLDLQHGFSLQPLNMNFQVLPGYDHVLTIKPTSSGIFSIICNEFCGIGHHSMTGRIIVED